jgi:AcrR family transcriptional regulator
VRADGSRIRWADNTPINADDARGRIVSAATECVRRFGPGKTTMDDVARAAGVSRPTVYKFFSSRNEVLVAALLRMIDNAIDRGLSQFFIGVTTPEKLRIAIADSMVYLLSVLRSDDSVQGILSDPRIPLDSLLTEATDLLVGVLGEALVVVLAEDIDEEVLHAVRDFDRRAAAQWIIRIIYTFLIWEDEEHEREAFLAFLSPALVADG